MPFYNVGETSKAIVGTTFQLRDAPLSDNSKVVKDILVSVCDCCGNICGLPQQLLTCVQKAIKKELY